MSKIYIKLAHKVNLLESITCLIFETNQDLEFEPGQFLAIEVSPGVHRSYSLFHCSPEAPQYYQNSLKKLQEGNYIGLMINTKPDGVGSQWAKNINLNEEFKAIGCNGQFTIRESINPKVFVGTSTGIAPFVPMINGLLKYNSKAKVTLFFGSLTAADDFAMNFFENIKLEYPNFHMISCYDEFGSDLEDGNHKLGRVTSIIPSELNAKEIQESDFYLCGNQFMVEATAKLLKEKGATNVYYEKY
jgi:ferredoxin-NADP reductase